MYIVKWCNHEGELETRSFERFEDASLEAYYLEDKYGWSEVIDECGGLLHW